MSWLLKLYDKILQLAQHKHAPRYLAIVSFIEASVFPIPPYVMLAPMALAKPDKALNYALIATLASVCGGVLGYGLGLLIFKPVVLPLLQHFGYEAAYEGVLQMFALYGTLALLILGVTPIPYKIVAIGCGFLSIPMHIFILTSLISRGAKFLLLSLLIKIGGPDLQHYMRRMLEKFGILRMSLFGILIFVVLKVV